jgi:hypothetical protein
MTGETVLINGGRALQSGSDSTQSSSGEPPSARAAHLRIHVRQRARFMGLPIANPDPDAVNPPAMANI